ncbi:Phage tail assembly [Lactococcus lactis subsp. lactis]|uniref:hypothetical protein n=1 Tax=Lactococcus lactis TaxID=1358 RepID=UPI00071DC570|nr:hypothetical protein [Lactococcus lactis]KST96304.1 Phage tail assembly [Lactococcus lactis subsp. lactis]
MSYEKQTWNQYDELKTEEENIKNGAVVTDNRMNHIEEGIYSHTIDISNPHKVTAAQVGLGNVQNFGLATEDEAKQGISNAKYMTPSLTQAVLSANINSTAYANSADGTDGFTTVYPNLNLLDGTKDFSGEGWVNFSGVPNDGTFKGLTIKSTSSQWNGIYKKYTIPKDGDYVFSVYASASANGVNPVMVIGKNGTVIETTVLPTTMFNIQRFDYMCKNLKKGDVVSGRIDKSGTATGKVSVAGHKWEKSSIATPYMPSASEVTTADWPKYVGFSNTVKTNKSASDYTWFPVKDSELTNKVDSHINNKANPHSVTASQVGAYSKDESDQKLAAQKQAIDSHVNNKANPHAVTASQVGAYSKQEIDTKLSKAVMADDSGKVSIGTLDSNTLTVQGTKIYPNTKDGVWTVERLFDNEYRLTTVMSVSEAVTNAWGALFISPEVSHPTLPSGYNKNSWSANLSNSTNLMWCSISGASAFRLIAGASTSAATRTVIVTVYASK